MNIADLMTRDYTVHPDYTFGGMDVTPEQYKQLKMLQMMSQSGMLGAGDVGGAVSNVLMPQPNPYQQLADLFASGGMGDVYPGDTEEELAIEVPDEDPYPDIPTYAKPFSEPGSWAAKFLGGEELEDEYWRAANQLYGSWQDKMGDYGVIPGTKAFWRERFD